MKKFLTICTVAFILTGCATGGSSDLMEGYAVMKLTEQRVKGDPEKAARVRALAEAVRAHSTGEGFSTVDVLMVEVHSRIEWNKLSPADQYFANEVLRLWRTDLVNRYGESPLPEYINLSVAKVAGWIMLAAQP